jgi:hypothetical protein
MSAADRYTVGDVARTLHVTDEGVRHLVREEQLACVRTPSGLRVFQEAEVLRLAAARDQARLRGVKVLRPKRMNVRGGPRQLSLFGLRKVK